MLQQGIIAAGGQLGQGPLVIPFGSFDVASVDYNQAEILAGATPKVIVPAEPGKIVVPILWWVHRAPFAAGFAVNASFFLTYPGATTNFLGTLTPQIFSNANTLFQSINVTSNFNNRPTQLGQPLQVVSVNNALGSPDVLVRFHVAFTKIDGLF